VAETLTANYSWTKPDPGGSANTWGSTLNGDLDAIDAQVYSNEQATVMIGCITMYGGATPPTNWLTCDGSSLATTGTYAKLFAVIGYAFGGSGANFNVPDLRSRFPTGASPTSALGSAGGSASAAIAVANLPAHAHPITDVAHSHTAQQNPHTHGASQGAHSHNASQDAHSHGMAAQVLTPNGGGNATAGAGWAFTSPHTDTQQPAVHIDTQQPPVYIDTQQPAVGVNASGTGLSTTNNTGSGSPIAVVPPYQAVNFIIRYQ
jgi:microcystin-dependent protein